MDSDRVWVEVNDFVRERVPDSSERVPVAVNDVVSEGVKVAVTVGVPERLRVTVADKVPLVRDPETEREADSVSTWVLVGGSLSVADHVGENPVKEPDRLWEPDVVLDAV